MYLAPFIADRDAFITCLDVPGTDVAPFCKTKVQHMLHMLKDDIFVRCCERSHSLQMSTGAQFCCIVAQIGMASCSH